MVVADLRSLQGLAQTLLDGVTQLARSATSQPSQSSLSRSVRRRRRRQSMLRKLYSAAEVDSSPLASEDMSVQVSLAQGLVVSSADLTPSPIPEGSTLHVGADAAPCAVSPAVQPLQSSNQVVALSDDVMATILCDLSFVQLNTYDCSRTALCSRIKAQLETDFKLLYDQLHVGSQQLNQLVQEMRLCETAVDNYALTPVLAQHPDNSSLSLETGVISEVSDALRPLQPIVSPLGQPAEECGPFDDSDAMGNSVASVKEEGPAGKYAKLAADLLQQVHLAASQAVVVSNVPAVPPPRLQSGQECKPRLVCTQEEWSAAQQ